MNFLTLTIFTALLVSCSSLHFKSTGRIPVSLTPQREHTKKVSFKVKKDFYLWGMIPKQHEVNVDEVYSEQGYNSIAEVRFYEDRDFWDTALSIATLGLYIPRTYIFEGKTFVRN